MLIDWFTVAAQAINFVILVGLMRRFLYNPVLEAIDAREKRVASELADADAKRAEAKKERDKFQYKNDEWSAERAALLAKAIAEAKTEGARLVDEARAAIEELRTKRQDALVADVRALSGAIDRRVGQEVFAIARKALADLATIGLEGCIVAAFNRRLGQMDASAKAQLRAALERGPEPATVRSAFELPAGERAAIQNALNVTLSADVRLRFETAPDLVGGIELMTNGQCLAWTIDGYLASLETRLAALLNEREQAAPAAPETAHRAAAAPADGAKPQLPSVAA